MSQNYDGKCWERELPGFINCKTFKGLVKDQIKLLEEPTLKTSLVCVQTETTPFLQFFII